MAKGSRGGKRKSSRILSGQRYENEFSNIFIRGVDSKKRTVRFIEGNSPSAIHNIQEIPINNFREYAKRAGYKLTGFYD